MHSKHTDLSPKELGIVESVLLDFNQHRLPRLIHLKKSVDDGERLNEYDIQFLDDSFNLSKGCEQFSEAHPEYKTLVAQVVGLYHHITSRALNNEKNINRE